MGLDVLVARPSKSEKIRASLKHPIIDGDGHVIEHVPTYLDYLTRVAGRDLTARFVKKRQAGGWYGLSPEERQSRRVNRPSWWSLPARNTLDRATAMIPNLLRARLDELGIDVTVIYTTIGLSLLIEPDDELRQATCRALNVMYAEMFKPHGDRIIPAAVLPMHTPDEAIRELNYAVGELGMKTVMIGGNVKRPIPAVQKEAPHLAHLATWIDTVAFDSAYDYDPLWRRCGELKVSVGAHLSCLGWGAHQSKSFIYNHTAGFAHAHEAFAKALILGGVTRRFPNQTFAFLEGGAMWATELYAGLVSRCGKRNRRDIQSYNHNNIDATLLLNLLNEYGADMIRGDPDPGKAHFGAPLVGPMAGFEEDPTLVDEFAACGAEKPKDIQKLFVPNFYFGCEADDPLTSVAFDRRLNPFGDRLKAMFSSDLGHWDVTNMREILEEAYELVEKELLTEEDFRDFCFVNPALFHARMNPRFFEGTVVADDVRKLLTSGAGQS